jgi:solute carrier family 13 (sodium-dependent dicarboxylate transporter), member 2/3/5
MGGGRLRGTLAEVKTFHEALAAVEVYSPSEELFNRRRRTAGLFLGPSILLVMLAAPLPLTWQAHRLAAVLATMFALWITEALPITVTALLGPVLAVVFQVAPARTALAPFADPIVFLFIGSFILAQAMFVHGLDRRIAYTALSWRAIGGSGPRILFVYGAVATALSMWISNTATTAMMFPIGLSIIAHLARMGLKIQGFAIAMMLIAAFGPSVGGMATPVGTPPNLIGIGMLERIAGVDISFFQWMAIGAPAVALLFVFLCALFYVASVRGVRVGDESMGHVTRELVRLGPVSRAERNVLLAFATTVLLWVAPGILAIVGAGDSAFARGYAASLPEGVAAMAGAILLFLLPVDWRARKFTLTWDDAVKIDWGIVFLYGGGLAMGELAFSTGLAEAMGKGITAWLPSHGTVTLTVLFTGTAIVLSEATSNTTSANMIVPIAIAVSQAAGVRAVEPALGATLGASMGFMMPISTAPNAIVYSSGYVPITAMMKFGVALDLVAFVVIVSLVLLLAPIVI